MLTLVGADCTLAEANLAPYVARLDFLGLLDIWIEARPNLRAWWKRARARPNFRTAIEARLSAKELEERRVCGARIRDRVRELRGEYLAGS